VPPIVERAFKPAGDVMTAPIARLRHRHGRCHAPASRTANEKEVIVQLDAQGFELAGETLREAEIDRLIWKGLPLYEDSPFADRPEVRNPDIGPLCAGAHIDELRTGLRAEALPRRRYVDIIDRCIGVPIAQETLPLSMQSNF
jgi:hypothetical protein